MRMKFHMKHPDKPGRTLCGRRIEVHTLVLDDHKGFLLDCKVCLRVFQKEGLRVFQKEVTA